MADSTLEKNTLQGEAFPGRSPGGSLGPNPFCSISSTRSKNTHVGVYTDIFDLDTFMCLYIHIMTCYTRPQPDAKKLNGSSPGELLRSVCEALPNDPPRHGSVARARPPPWEWRRSGGTTRASAIWAALLWVKIWKLAQITVSFKKGLVYVGTLVKDLSHVVMSFWPAKDSCHLRFLVPKSVKGMAVGTQSLID